MSFLALVLYGTMSGDKTNLYNPVLALIIVGFVLESLSAGVRLLLSGADHSYPIVLISANAGTSLYFFYRFFFHFYIKSLDPRPQNSQQPQPWAVIFSSSPFMCEQKRANHSTASFFAITECVLSRERRRIKSPTQCSLRPWEKGLR